MDIQNNRRTAPYHSKLLMVLCTILLMVGCKSPKGTDPLFIDMGTETEFLFDSAEGVKEIPLSTNITSLVSRIEDSTAKEWLTVRVMGDKIALRVTANGMKTRYTKVIISGSGQSVSFMVRQAGMAPSILVTPEANELSEKTQKLVLSIQSNIEYELTDLPEGAWVTVETHDKTTTPHQLTLDIAQNITLQPRTLTLVFKSTSTTPQVTTEVKITQAAASDYSGNSSAAITGDFKVVPSSAQASSFQSGEDLQKSIDGDYTTIYHSSWNNNPANYFPIELVYNFKKPEDLDYLVYHPRKDGSINGHFKQTEIWIKTAGNSYVKLKDYDFGGQGAPTKVAFGSTQEKVEAVKFVIKSGNGHGQGFASCSEMEFFRNNSENIVPLNIFTDGTASELKSGVTEAAIQKIKNPLFREIAQFMHMNKYPKEFRIADYKAWPHPSVAARKNKTNLYSLLDNPTGISVSRGEDLIVFVGDTYGQTISLRLLNLDKPGGDGYYDTYIYPLSVGINKIKMDAPGLLYILYHTENYKSAPTIHIHFATGKVQGYFDTAKHSPERYKELLAKANNCKYFDVVGKNAHLCFPVESYRSFTKDKGPELIELYDRLVRDEQEFLGINKYHRYFGNRAFFHVMYHAYMYSTRYRTAYSEGTLNVILDPDKLPNHIWGPAHELGHTHQTRPGLVWHGMTEVTTNIHSLIIQTSWGKPSRLQNEKMPNGFIHRYNLAYYKGFAEAKPFSKIDDVFCQLVSFWQLQLYFAKVKGMEDFYKDLYERVRIEPDLSDAGENQLAFVRRASQTAGYDLTSFFEHWGYFRPVNEIIDDYGKKKVEITAQAAANMKAEVKKLNLKPITQAIQYINDDNWTIYRDQLSVTAGGKATYTSGSKNFSVPSNWKNYVAIEVYNAQNKLVGASNEKEVVLTEALTEGAKAYAIAQDGKKVEIEF